jgi:hypothetical protein
MRLARTIPAFLAAVLTIALLASCGGSPSTGGSGSSATLPLYSGAKVLEGGSPIAAAIDAAKQNLKQQQSGADTTVDAYTLPAGTTFDQVKKFYADSLAPAGWTDAAGGAAMPSVPNGGAAVWTKDNHEVFSITVMPDPLGGGSVLLVAHAVPK